jgi:hypothetical protein
MKTVLEVMLELSQGSQEPTIDRKYIIGTVKGKVKPPEVGSETKRPSGEA